MTRAEADRRILEAPPGDRRARALARVLAGIDPELAPLVLIGTWDEATARAVDVLEHASRGAEGR